MNRKGDFTTLPPSCSDCRPHGGMWRENENGGFERCSCLRGRMLAEASPVKRRKRKSAFDGKAAAVGNR